MLDSHNKNNNSVDIFKGIQLEFVEKEKIDA